MRFIAFPAHLLVSEPSCIHYGILQAWYMIGLYDITLSFSLFTG
nr:MAG TPA: hypothetical protein [Caudoviricetes sp.]